RYLLDRCGTTYKVQQEVLREALIEYLDRNSMAPPMPEKKPEKRKIPPNRQPLEVRDPDLAQKIVAYYGAGKRSGGHSRSETAKEFGLGEGQIDKIIRRAR
ncbi:hypothetical protein M0R72_06755, partial [Candidatus Pacearchaeota archaeon]|nr:hypothetical protein [Candidatus Pacearchaeota archaeon]